MNDRTRSEANASSPPSTRRGLILAILCLVGITNYVDRQVMGILLEPIKAEFGASDTAMGFLTGLMFAGCYAAAAIPLAWLSDRRSRSKVLAGCVIVWSSLTSLGGFAQSFWQLALTRVGVAVSESGGVPASHSMISDMYEPSRRGGAIAILSSAQAAGIGLGLALGGILAQSFDWRWTFILVGIPGILLAIPLLMMKDAPRGISDGITRPVAHLGFADTFRTLWRLKTYRNLVLIIGLGSFPGYGMLAWGPAMLMRIHGMESAEVGLWLGISVGSALVIGNLVGGFLADWAGQKDSRYYLWIAGGGPLVAAPFLVGFALADSPPLIFLCAFCGQLLLTFHIAPAYAMGQTIAPPNIRATASVVMGLASILVGAGMGPFVIGGMADVFALSAGTESVRYSLAVACACAAFTIIPALLGARTVRQDLIASRRIAEGAAAPDALTPASAKA
jgi:predicted MFS family arabinose efflux permease